MWLGFSLAAYSVVGNDVIQTLGTFLTSNEKNVKWYWLWTFAASILLVALVMGFYDPFGMFDYKYPLAYGRLDDFSMPETYHWYHLLPPIVLLLVTRSGIPISTTFMILTLFSLQDIPAHLGSMVSSVFDSDAKLGGMIFKSIMGYVIAFSSAAAIYLAVSKYTEKKFIETPLTDNKRTYWMVLQWLSTGFLWFQWLTQDLANIFIYLRGGATLNSFEFLLSTAIILGLLAYIFYRRGGAVQQVVRSKTNTADIRSATIIDFIYAMILLVFKNDFFNIWGAKLPMSTTWIFIGLLAGRELGIKYHLDSKIKNKVKTKIFADLGKVFFGLVVSVLLVFAIKLLAV